MPNTKLTVNFDALPDFQVAPNIPAASWQEQMRNKDETSLLGEVIRFATKVARLSQVAAEVDKAPIKKTIPWAISIADTNGISGHGVYIASRWLAHFWIHGDKLAAWFNDGQHKSSFTPSQRLISVLTR